MSESSDDDDNYEYIDQPEKIEAEKPHEEENILDNEQKNIDENVQSPEKEEKNVNEIPELKAEWTVHAQLRISRPGEIITKEFNTNDPTQQQQQQQQQKNPVHVIYNWSTTNDGKTEKAESNKPDENVKKSGGIQRNQSKKSTASKDSLSGKGHYGSFHSTAEDSGNFSNASKKKFTYGTRCRSTCNIILSAVADFLPDSNREIPEETDPFVFNTSASYTVSPEQPGDYQQTAGNASQNFALGKILALRDATSQTSDTETKYFEPTPFPFKTLQQIEQQQQHNKHGGRKRTPYEYRRLTDSILPSPTQQQQQQQVRSFADEGHSIPPSYTSSPARTYKSPSLPKIPIQQQQQRFAQSPAAANYPTGSDSSPKLDQKKPPRTVHIDVYCTGSEEDENEDDDEDDDVNSTTSTTSDENRNDIESNSTPQTVLDTEQMLLRHQRVVGRNDLPRRFLNQQQLLQQQQQNTMIPTSFTQSQNIPEINIGHAITKSTTAEEISESKQILFKKHIGDQRMNKINLNRYRNIRKDPSDDAISSNYPNSSSRSTMRDLTCSSLSSYAVPPSHDIDTSSWKETEPITFNKSDSFEYDNSVDRMRIRSMERQWEIDQSEMQQNIYSSDVPAPQYHLHQQHYPQQQEQQYQQQQYQQSQHQQQQQQHYQQPQQQHYQYEQEPSSQMHPQQQARIQHFLQSYQPQSNIEYPWRHQSQQQQHQPPTQYSDYQELPKFSGDFYTFSNKTIPERDEPPPSPLPNIPTSTRTVSYSPHYQQLPYIAGRGYRYGSEDRSIPFEQLERKRGKVMFTADYNKSGSEASTLQSNLSGYTNEYLTKARRFGSVVTAMKKPGHHIGPAKNPECECEHCRRWVAERTEGRNRAYSLGDTPRGVFWLSRND